MLDREALERLLKRVAIRLVMIQGRKTKDAAYEAALAAALADKAWMEEALKTAVEVSSTEVSSARAVAGPKKIRPKGFELSLGNARLAEPVRLNTAPEESYGEDHEILGDGCGTWGRSWAAKTGKHSLRNMVNRQDYQAEMTKRLSVPTYQVGLDRREQNRSVSDKSVHDLFTKRQTEMAELESWDTHIEERDNSYVLNRYIIWKLA